jgi:hypothetical protein
MDVSFSADLFRPHVGSVFALTSAKGEEFALRLDSVECKTLHDIGPYHNFTLLYSSVGKVFFPQGTYSLRHAVLGELDIFLTALAETDTTFKYQAPFTVKKPELAST